MFTMPLHWKLAIGAGVAALVLGLLALIGFQKAEVVTAKQEAAQQEGTAVVNKGQADLNEQLAAIIAAGESRNLHVTVQGNEDAHAVEIAPGGDTPIPPAVYSEWSAGIDSLRLEAEAAARGRAENSGVRDTPQAVPAS